MKIFSAQQIRDCDAFTIENTPVKSIDLMERAASACADHILANYEKGSLFVVFCGTGNNGGDGLALARLLHREGYGVKAFLLQSGGELSEDCSINLKRLQKLTPVGVEVMQPDTFISGIAPNIIIIDALFGTGLNRPVEGWLARFIERINALPNWCISIDIPSGLAADVLPAKGQTVVQADQTLSFQFYKRSMLHPEGGRFCGHVHILDIGLSRKYIDTTQTHYNIISRREVNRYYCPRRPFSNKGTYGTALIIGGNYGMMGAAALATKAACRAGAGKVFALIPEVGYDTLQGLVPEAMCITKAHSYIDEISDWEQATAIGIGCGLGTQHETAKALATFVDAVKEPLVLDADALNIMAKQPEMLTKVPAGSILTPHPKEFERLFGPSGDSMQRLELARILAMRYNIYILLKDRHSVVVTPEGDCWYNLTGNAGLATAGSGDVLTGIITGLLAQGYTPLASALMGIYLHGVAGELASKQHSMEAMVAGDITEQLGKAFRTLVQ